MVLSLKYFRNIWFAEHQNHVILFKVFVLNNNSVKKNINIQEALFFSFLKNLGLKKQKNHLH